MIESEEPRVVGPGFHAKVHRVVSKVPRGRVVSYGDVAKALGSVRVARHVGFALAALPPDSRVPWFRVVNSRGNISFPADDPRAVSQRRRLGDEGIEVSMQGRVQSFSEVRYSVDNLREKVLRDEGRRRS